VCHFLPPTESSKLGEQRDAQSDDSVCMEDVVAKKKCYPLRRLSKWMSLDTRTHANSSLHLRRRLACVAFLLDLIVFQVRESCWVIVPARVGESTVVCH
jgi:hypothetical protein